MAGETLAHTECNGCEGVANIKQRANSKNILYLHCPTCGLDQRTGKKIQAFWRGIVDGSGTVEQAIKPAQHAPKQEQEESEPEPELSDWKPDQQTQKITNDAEHQECEKRAPSGFKVLVGGLLTVASVAGMVLYKK